MYFSLLNEGLEDPDTMGSLWKRAAEYRGYRGSGLELLVLAHTYHIIPGQIRFKEVADFLDLGYTTIGKIVNKEEDGLLQK